MRESRYVPNYERSGGEVGFGFILGAVIEELLDGRQGTESA